MRRANEWRLFEQLVARIEQAAAPRAAVVTSPDRIRDLVTGKMREVDASIRYKLGTASVLITIECRKRGRKADDTWLEQLATKRAKLGAAMTIAVSATGFSKSAIATAGAHGIELRTLSEVSASDIEAWFLPSGGTANVFQVVDDLHCYVCLRDTKGEAEPTVHLIIEQDFAVFHHAGVKSPFPTMELFSLVQRKWPHLFRNVPLDGSKYPFSVTVTYPPQSLQMEIEGERRDVHNTLIQANVSYETALLPLEQGTHHIYATPEGRTVQHSSFQTKMFGHPARFEFQSDGTETPKGSVHFLSKPKK
jgi:hypothetical protein